MPSIKEKVEINKALWRDTSWDELATFIGPNAEKYRAFYDKTKQNMIDKGNPGFQFNWHWPALIPILGIPWAAARKDWGFVAILAAAIVAVNILAFFMPNASFGFMFFLAPAMAKQTYVQNAMAKIGKIKAAQPEGSARTEAIKSAGGLNMTYGFVAGGICAAFIVLSVVALVIGSA